ncbi:MAG: hypothetical protein IJ949_07180, partial [Oscillospiraceae bacterium]|nr:hypothetical protein [Oscillospiraceae bacterium]
MMYCSTFVSSLLVYLILIIFVFCHVEAPDECGHDGDIELKVKSIERIDEEILAPVKKYLDESGEDY